MPYRLNLKYLFLFRILPVASSLLLFSCGLKYVPSESPLSFEQRRQDAVENYIQNDISSTKQIYTSVAFGESQIIKPISYKTLDSLYELKYKNEQIGKLDKDLDTQIENQRMITLNDTNQVIYIEDHVFALGIGDTLEFYSAQFQMEKDLVIDDVILKESVYIPKRYKEFYLQYIFEESIIDPGFRPTSEEINFYTFFKQAVTNLSKIEKDAFILHTLQLMELATRKKSINTTTLLKAKSSKHFNGFTYSSINESFSEILEESELNEKNEKIIIGYKLTYRFKTKTDTQEQIYLMEYDPYLRLIQSTKL